MSHSRLFPVSATVLLMYEHLAFSSVSFRARVPRCLPAMTWVYNFGAGNADGRAEMKKLGLQDLSSRNSTHMQGPMGFWDAEVLHVW